MSSRAHGLFSELDRQRKELMACLIRGDRRQLVALVFAAIAQPPLASDAAPPALMRFFLRPRSGYRMCEAHAEEAQAKFFDVLLASEFRQQGTDGVVGWIVTIAGHVRSNASRKCRVHCMRTRLVDADDSTLPPAQENEPREERAEVALLWSFARGELDRLSRPERAALEDSARSVAAEPPGSVPEPPETALDDATRSALELFNRTGELPDGAVIPFRVGTRAWRRDLVLWLCKYLDLRTWVILDVAPEFSTPNGVNARWRDWRQRFREFAAQHPRDPETMAGA